MKNQEYLSLADQYSANEQAPNAADAYADAFTRAGSQPVAGPQDAINNAVLGGVGAGIKAASNQKKNDRLGRLQEQTAQLLELDANFKQQMYEQEGQKQQSSQFFKQNAVPIAELSKAALAGDTNATDQIARGIFRSYKQFFQDPNIGDYDHFNNGTIYFENLETGNIEGRNIIQLMYQNGINPAETYGQDAPTFEAGLSPGARINYENTEKMRALQMEEARLKNQQIQSSIDLNRFRAQPQASSPKQEAPVEQESSDQQILSILDNAENTIKKLGADAVRGGFNRALEDYIPGGFTPSPAQAEVNAIGDILRGKLFNAFGYRNETEFNHIPSISINNSPETNLAIVEKLRELYLKSKNQNNNLPAQENNNTPQIPAQGQVPAVEQLRAKWGFN